MNHCDIIVIGGGAAGLMAAYTLSKAGRQVTILEARDRLGGRIHTLDNRGFTQPAEAGAEFIHGNLPVTLGLLKEANIAYKETQGEIWRRKNQQLIKAEDFMEQGDLVFTRLQELKEDIDIETFLHRYFDDNQYEDLRNSIRGFVEGYDAADTRKASAFALRKEWDGEDQPQYRPAGGYAKLVAFLEDASRKNGCRIHVKAAVKTVKWKTGSVELDTEHEQYTACKLIITLPLNVFKARPPEKGAIAFTPALSDQLHASQLMGAGSVIKILLEFTGPVWKDAHVRQNTGADLSKAGWLFSDEPIPTWWTQLPQQSNLLTGWIAGPKAAALAGSSDEEILLSSMQSLASIFSVSFTFLKQQLRASEVINWDADPFARGAYAYNTVQTSEARKVLLQPVENTLFFAGEALYEGPEMGTVEGALSSGKSAAEKLLKQA